jgi:DNA polymerase II
MEQTGWLFDLYPEPGSAAEAGGLAIWLVCENGERLRLSQPFPVSFYASGPPARLRDLWRFLRNQTIPCLLRRDARRELFSPRPIDVLGVQVDQPSTLPGLFRLVQQAFPDLTYFDADLGPALRHAAVFGSFPLARCRVIYDDHRRVQHFETLDTPWDLDPEPPRLRILALEPDSEPAHRPPRALLARFEQYDGHHFDGRHLDYRFPLEPGRALLVNLSALLNRHDPDLILTTWGDTWLLPRLLEWSQQHNLPLPLNRDKRLDASHRPAHSYFSYGQIVYRGQQVHLAGRWHIDCDNALLYDDFALEGILEFARVTRLPVQDAARLSPGTGISSMQIVTALQQGILVPWRKERGERPKTALELLQRDQGGLVYQPLVGVHANVGEVDFVSMYPSLMVRFNISPETAGEQPGNPGELERFDSASSASMGLIPLTLAPLLEKRIAFKTRLGQLPAWDPRRQAAKARSSAHKWLLVTCFGYLGYSNARFGRIEAHEMVTAYGREALLRAKEAAEDLGGIVLHIYVDGLWIKRPGWEKPEDFQPLLEVVAQHTGLSISLDGIYRWVAFLPSRVDGRVPVANRYFGVFQDGSLKVRGIEARRRDTAPWIAEIQMALLEHLAQAVTLEELPALLPGAVAKLRLALADLQGGRVPLEKLVIAQKLSRVLEAYRTPSPAARAAAQLREIGKEMEPGQRVRFIFTRGRPGVYAWHLPDPPDPTWVDTARYRVLLLRAGHAILGPFGVSEAGLFTWAVDNARYPGKLLPQPARRRLIDS